MKSFIVIVAGMVACLTAFAAIAADEAKPDAPADDAQVVQGTWTPIEAELAGKPLPDAVLKTITLKLQDGKYEVLADGTTDRGTCTLDTTTTPRGMTITGTEGPNRGKTFPAIYELPRDGDHAGDKLRICYDLSGQKRPTEFKTAAKTKLYLVTYSRKKD